MGLPGEVAKPVPAAMLLSCLADVLSSAWRLPGAARINLLPSTYTGTYYETLIASLSALLIASLRFKKRLD